MPSCCKRAAVGPVLCRAQIGLGSAPPPAVAGRGLVIADAFLPGAVEIGVGRDAGLDGGGDHRVAQWRPHRVRHVERSADPVEFVGAALLVLRLFEKRQHVFPIPALAAALAPIVIVGGRAAHIDHAVDRAGAAEDLAARLVEGAAVELRLGLALEHPVDPGVGVRLGVAERDMDPRVAVRAAGFEQQHAIFSGFAEPRRHRAARRTGAGDDEVECLCRVCHALPLICGDLPGARTIANGRAIGKSAGRSAEESRCGSGDLALPRSDRASF